MPKAQKSRGIASFSLALAAVIGIGAANGASAEEPAAFGSEPPKTVLTEHSGFDRGSMMASDWATGGSVSGFSLLNPNRFSMHQSYSVGFSSGSFGSASAGVYLNTLSYRLADPLTLTADVGFYTPLYSSTGSFSRSGFQDPRAGSSLIFPHVGLEYKPSENTSISLHLFNGQDAWKAYGGDPFLSPFR